MPTSGLSVTAQVALDGAGNGVASIGPVSAREVWHPEAVHVSVNTDNNEAVCNIFIGDAAEQRNFRDATSSGSIGDSSDRVQGDLRVGHKVFAQWVGGDPGSFGSLTVTGSRDV